MIEDELLKWRFKHGSKEALQRIYQKYLNYMLTLAMALLHNATEAEDIVHDVFVSFAESAADFKLTGNLKSYLTTCVLNRARDRLRTNQRQVIRPDRTEPTDSDINEPDHRILSTEESLRLNHAFSQIPVQQREVVVLRLKSRMKFREIAKLQGVSVNTIQGRYRYGLDKLRSLLNGEVTK
ncbi:MAG: sigma-70 family RNA polymerase sigma factor [Sedimentisphaerales bacterium]|nr:sigma-70 family RNA polymerase sigma factor [Sedimentisphaerales bacterium]